MSTVSDVTNVNYSGDNRVDSLLYSGADWNYLLPIRTTLFYTFDLSYASSKFSGVSGFNASQQAAAQAILAYASSVTGISFAKTNSGATADFHFANTNLAGSTTAGLSQTHEGWSFTSNNVLTSYTAEAIVLLDNVEFFSINNTLAAGNSGYEILLHEIGHALGLGHPFDGEYLLPTAQDNTNNTVMSYTEAGANKSTFQSYDLLALDWIYGRDGLGGRHGYNSTFGLSLGGVTNSSPVAANGSASTREDTALTATLPAAMDANGDALTYALASNAAHGVVTVSANGRYSYTPTANYNGSDSFSFTVSDPSNASNSYTMALSVEAVNDAPTGSVTVAGSAVQGQTLNAANTLADVDGLPAGSIRYQWRADNVALSGATTSTLVLSGSHVGKAITVTASYADAQGTNESVISKPTALVTASDTTAPTIITFTPGDEATGVATVSNIVVTFSEAVARGTGNIVLKTTTGVTVATYDAATSSNLSISGSTLTLNPTADLTAGTAYKVEFAAGSLKDLAGNSYAGTTSYNFTTISAGVIVTGTAGPDNLIGTAGADTLQGGNGNDILNGMGGNDALEGGGGVDTAAFSGARAGYTVTRGSGDALTVSGADGTDILSSVERLEFSDVNVAMDVNGNAGTVAKIIGSVFGAGVVKSRPDYVGIGLTYLDGGMTYEALAALAIGAAGVATPEQIVSLLWKNVVGTTATAADAQPYIDMLNNGMGVGALGVLASETDLNKLNIELVGVAATGVDYI